MDDDADAVSNAGAASLGAKIYVVGGLHGRRGHQCRSGVQPPDLRYRHPDLGECPPLPKALMQCAVTSLGSKLYAFGGLKSTGTNSYAAVTDAYVLTPRPMPGVPYRHCPTATAYAAVAPTRVREDLGHGRLQPTPARELSRESCRNSILPPTNGPPNSIWSDPGAGPPDQLRG